MPDVSSKAKHSAMMLRIRERGNKDMESRKGFTAEPSRQGEEFR